MLNFAYPRQKYYLFSFLVAFLKVLILLLSVHLIFDFFFFLRWFSYFTRCTICRATCYCCEIRHRDLTVAGWWRFEIWDCCGLPFRSSRGISVVCWWSGSLAIKREGGRGEGGLGCPRLRRVSSQASYQKGNCVFLVFLVYVFRGSCLILAIDATQNLTPLSGGVDIMFRNEVIL